MAAVNVLNIQLADPNPASIGDAIKFTVTFEALEDLQEDVQWKLIYVASAESDANDYELDDLCVGPVTRGQRRFVFETAAPNLKELLNEYDDVHGYHAILLSGMYKGQEFVRVGYYVQNLYEDPALNEDPPTPPQWDDLKRLIFSDEPRMTKFVITWDEEEAPLGDALPVTNITNEVSCMNGNVLPVTSDGSGDIDI